MYSVLAVDDEKTNLDILNYVLSPEYTVYTVKSGEAALELLATGRPDLILLDIVMPGMDGFEVLAKLKSSPGTQNIPVIIITTLDNPEDEEKGFNLGAGDYITKPFKPVVIRARVNAQLKNIALIQAEKSLAQAEYYSKTKSDFLSRMSHEMRTPLNAIMGMTAVAQMANDHDQIMNCLEQIDGSSCRLLGLINDLLDMAKIDAGGFELAPGQFSFKETIEGVIADISSKAEAKGQHFTVELDPAIPDSLIADEERLEQVLLHLLSNAVKFTPEGGSVRFTVHRIASQPEQPEEDACILCFEVKDTGIGISEELKTRLGSAFEQVDNGITRMYGGMGLGLAISKRIVQMMGGSIEVESAPGKGARFICTVKLRTEHGASRDGNAGGGNRSPPAAAPLAAPLAGCRVLVVDDVDINRDILCCLLEHTGAVLDEAQDGREALGKVLQNTYDLVLMDLHMPRMDGYDAARRIRDSGIPGTDSLPIIAVTADTGGDVVSRCLKAGMNAHTGKPVNYDRLIGVITECIPRLNGRIPGEGA
ncbi:MAG: response regulator [Treponema sp.]|nr:response regulator [Treponema sp.]